MSHPRVCRKNGLPIRQNFESKEPSPRGVGLNILLDGDPQAGYPAILVLTDSRCHLSVFTLSRLSQARGIAKKLYAVYTGVEPALPTVTGWCSTVKLVDQNLNKKLRHQRHT